MSIIIYGGGMTGAILAFMLFKLTQGNLKISLIERYVPHYYDNVSIVNTPNVIALSRGAYHTLIQSGMYSILSACSTVINTIEISEHGTLNKIIIDAQDYKISELGYVVEASFFRRQLFNFLSQIKSITMYCPATLHKIIRKKKTNIVYLNDGTQIVSKLIVAADGSNSVLAANCGIQWIRHNYQQIAVVSTITTEIPHTSRAFEQFTMFGSLALLPISKNSSFLIWCITSGKKEEISTWNKNRFARELQHAFGWRLGKILDIGPRYFYDLWLIHAKNRISHRLVLVGNAAQNLHPIAGQGFNLGLRDVIVLSQMIAQTLYQNMDIGDYSMLSVYQQRRSIDQHKTIKMTDGLIRLFSSRYLPLIIARKFGLFCMSHSTLLQRLLINSLLSWKL